MILKDKRQVVIINDIRSDKIEQAIFILRDKNDRSKPAPCDSDLVIEALKIINSFLYPGTYGRGGRRRSMMSRGALWLASAAFIVAVSAMLIRLIAPI